MTRLRSPLLSLAFALLCVGGGVMAADPPRSADVVSRIERETGGRVLSAQRSLRGGREVNRIKLLTPEGRVRVMWDDPSRDRGPGTRRGERSRQPAVDAARQAAAEREAALEPRARDDG
jgi:hypothetical protein